MKNIEDINKAAIKKIIANKKITDFSPGDTIKVGLKWKKIQDKFKLLVKKFHPDINAGNKKYEEKLKLISLAYTQLKNTYRDKIDTKS